MNAHSLIGTYRLVTWENRDALGKPSYPLGADAQGFINYSPDGYMFVHIMAKHRQMHAAPEIFGGSMDENEHSATTHLSYCGKYELQGNEVIHHVSACSFPNWVNTQQRRRFQFKNGQLMLTAQGIRFGDTNVDACLTWQRVSHE